LRLKKDTYQQTGKGLSYQQLSSALTVNPPQAAGFLTPAVRWVSRRLEPFHRKSSDISVVMWWTINMEYQRDEHRVHLIVYHLIWCPKRRKAVLVGDVAADCERFIRAKCEQQGWTLL